MPGGHKKQKRTTKKKSSIKKHKQGSKSKAGKRKKASKSKTAVRVRICKGGVCKMKKPNYDRPGPAVSATSVPIGTVKRGNKGGMWQVQASGKSQRWVKQ